MKKIMLPCYVLICTLQLPAQTDSIPFFKGAIKEKRITQHRNLLNNTISKNLSLPLTDSTEENWMDAFWAIELLHYNSPWIENKIFAAFDTVTKRSTTFQRALVELVYSNYGDLFHKMVKELFDQTTNGKIFAICGEYLFKNYHSPANTGMDIPRTIKDLQKITSDPACYDIFTKKYMPRFDCIKDINSLQDLFKKDYLKGNVLLFSFQRPDRNFPGLAIVRDTAGNFVTDETGNIFSIPQLAKAVSNLPGYLPNGNTPQGIFRMDGFSVSKSNFIGPTPNVQLTLPVETSLQHFFKDSTITDSVWTENWYRKIFPASWQRLFLKGNNYYIPSFETYYAGKAGRTEIIAHGTTISPEDYKEQPFYPLTPTQGCLSGKEIWSDVNGKRLESDQQQLVDVLQKAGGANGYCIVVELDDLAKPVTIQDILPLLKQ